MSSSITVRREIKASPETLFNAWLDPKSLGTWMRPGASTFGCSTKVDARVGGSFEVVMHRPPQEGDVKHTGVYRVIDRYTRLAFTWISRHTYEKESLVTVDFIPRGSACEVVITHTQLPDDKASAHTGGWTDALGLLAKHTEQ